MNKAIAVIVWSIFVFTGCENRTPSPIVWDLARGSTIDKIGWPDDNTSDAYEQYEDTNIKIILPGGKELSGDIFYFGSVRRGDNLHWVVIHFRPQNINNLVARANALLDYFEADQRCYEMLSEWEWRRLKGHVERFQTTISHLNPPHITVAITHDGKMGSASVNVGFSAPVPEKQ